MTAFANVILVLARCIDCQGTGTDYLYVTCEGCGGTGEQEYEA